MDMVLEFELILLFILENKTLSQTQFFFLTFFPPAEQALRGLFGSLPLATVRVEKNKFNLHSHSDEWERTERSLSVLILPIKASLA
jgi:hypothetical protein